LRLTRGDRLKQLSVTVFGVSMVVLYAASGVFHALQLPPPELRPFQKFDQSAIFTLIAGTCTPIMALLLSGSYRRWMLGGIWVMAFTGITCLWCIPNVPHEVMVGLYLAMGYFGFSGAWRYYQAVGLRGLLWCTGGAGLYTLGAVCELAHWPIIWPGVIQWHEMLHICDMAATFCFFVFVVHYVLPYRPRTADSSHRTAAVPAPIFAEG